MNKKFLSMAVIGSVLGMLWTSAASAVPIIENGSFEIAGNSLGGGSGWKYYDPSQVDGWNGSNIELWSTHGITSYDGQNHAELNAHGGSVWSIFQNFDTVDGQNYQLFFAYSARLGNSQESMEAFDVDVAGINMDISDHVVGTWSTKTINFVGDGNPTTLRFTSTAQGQTTYGNFLDKVSVTEVPEPTSLALLGLGLLGLGLRRRVKAA